SLLWHTVLRAQSAPGFPCALFRERDNEMATPRADRAAGMRTRVRRHTRLSSPGLTGRPSIPETAVIEPKGRGVLDTPWVHEASATPARVLLRWDDVMASSALKSALRSTACMQAADLKTILHRRLTEPPRRSVGNCGATTRT